MSSKKAFAHRLLGYRGLQTADVAFLYDFEKSEAGCKTLYRNGTRVPTLRSVRPDVFPPRVTDDAWKHSAGKHDLLHNYHAAPAKYMIYDEDPDIFSEDICLDEEDAAIQRIDFLRRTADGRRST